MSSCSIWYSTRFAIFSSLQRSLPAITLQFSPPTNKGSIQKDCLFSLQSNNSDPKPSWTKQIKSVRQSTNIFCLPVLKRPDYLSFLFPKTCYFIHPHSLIWLPITIVHRLKKNFDPTDKSLKLLPLYDESNRYTLLWCSLFKDNLMLVIDFQTICYPTIIIVFTEYIF